MSFYMYIFLIIFIPILSRYFQNSFYLNFTWKKLRLNHDKRTTPLKNKLLCQHFRGLWNIFSSFTVFTNSQKNVISINVFLSPEIGKKNAEFFCRFFFNSGMSISTHARFAKNTLLNLKPFKLLLGVE